MHLLTCADLSRNGINKYNGRLSAGELIRIYVIVLHSSFPKLDKDSEDFVLVAVLSSGGFFRSPIFQGFRASKRNGEL